MLKIRTEHCAALSQLQMTSFVSRMSLHLREIFPKESVITPDPTLALFIAKVTQKGKSWGITTESLLERLIEIFFVFETLRREPLPGWINEVVEYPRPPGEQIVQMLEDQLLFGELISEPG